MKFRTHAEGMEYVGRREKEIGKMRYRSTAEYHSLYKHLEELYKNEGHKKPKRRKVEIRFCISG